MCIITSACMWVPIFNLLSIGRQHSHILCNNPTSTKSGVSLHVYISHPYSNLNNHQPSPEFTDIILISSLKSPPPPPTDTMLHLSLSLPRFRLSFLLLLSLSQSLSKSRRRLESSFSIFGNLFVIQARSKSHGMGLA